MNNKGPSPGHHSLRPQTYDEALSLCRTTMYEFNSESPPKPLTVTTLVTVLGEKGIKITRPTLNRWLMSAGFKFGRPSTESAMHENSGVLLLRARYLRLLRDKRGIGDLPQVPIVVLDETYCHENHQSGRIWIPDTKKGIAPLKRAGGRFNIIGAGEYWEENGKLRGGFVPGSFVYWDAAKKPGGRGRGRPRAEDEPSKRQRTSSGSMPMSGHIDKPPDAPQGNHADYHGNMNAEVFERWFEELCANLKHRRPGALILMDGARYHRRNVDMPPNSASKVAELKTWLSRHRISFDEDARKPALVKIVAAYRKAKAHYACVDIARKYGLSVLFTPPYHPELQPIEKIWAVIKNRIAGEPARKMAALGEVIGRYAEEVNESAWLGAWKKCRGFEDFYQRESEDNIVSEDDVDAEQQADELEGFNDEQDVG